MNFETPVVIARSLVLTMLLAMTSSFFYEIIKIPVREQGIYLCL